jgi:hypothetical protein
MTEINNLKPEVGDTIQIIEMLGEPNYSGKNGIIRTIDSMGQLHGTWGGLAVIPEEDVFRIIKKEKDI